MTAIHSCLGICTKEGFNQREFYPNHHSAHPMSTQANIIRYIFKLGNEEITYEIDIDFQLSNESSGEAASYPEWTLLKRHQCECCPLKDSEHLYCPAAIRMHQVLDRFKGHGSIQQIELRVEKARRNYEISCDLQNGLNSMLGLQMATSGCPVVGELRSMATFHTPYSSFAETLYRAVSGYLTKQYFVQQNGGEPDWELKGLQAFFNKLEGLNQDFSQRIQEIDQNDAISNAMVMFFASSIIIADLIDDGLTEYQDYFTGQTSLPPEA